MLKRVAENGGAKEASGPTATGKEWKDVENLANEVAARPEMFVGGNEALAKRLANATKHFFDLGRTWEDQAAAQHGGPLPELALEGFEAEQLFEQLALHHTPLLRYLRRQTNNFAKGCERRPAAFFPFMPLTEEEDQQEELLDDGEDQDGAAEEEVEDADEGEEEDDEEEDEDDELGVGSMNGADVSVGDEDDDEDGEEDDEEDDDEEEDDEDVDVKQKKKTQQQQKTKKQTGDHFFSFEDMDRFVEEGEMLAEKERDEEDGIRTAEDRDGEDDIEDAFEDIEAEDEEGELDMEMLGDLDEDDDDDEEDEDLDGDDDDEEDDDAEAGGLGGDIRYDQFFDALEDQKQAKKALAKKMKKKSGGAGGHMEEQIEELEDKIVGSKPWQLRGEVNNRKRPINSLLEEHVEFETAIKQAPVITEEVTMALEDIIKQRIIEGSFDDVVRKEEDEVVARRAPPELDFQKSQKSLAELYEEEYLKSVDKAAANPLAVPEEKKKTKEQEEVLRRFAKLAYQLDALSNFHFTPKPIIAEVAVKENVAAIRMEEIIPVGVSDSSLLAPQEIFAPDRRDNALPARDSASQKKLRRKRRKSTGLKPGAGLPAGKNVKRAERAEGGPMTSTKLFKQLTQEAHTTKGAKLPKARPQDTAPKRSATALKL